MYLKDYDKRIYKEVGLTQKQTRAVIRQLEIEMRRSVIFGEEIVIHNFGKFKLPIRKARTRINIKTLKPEKYPSRYELVFRTQVALSKRIKQKTVYDGSY